MTNVNPVAGCKPMRAMARFAALIACASVLVLFSPALAALTCHADNVILNYGAYDVLAVTVLDAAGTIVVTCTKNGTDVDGAVSYSIVLTPLSPRQLAPPSGSDRLSHQFYTDSARTQTWGDGTGGTLVINGSFSVPKDSTKSDAPINFYGRITPAGQDVSAASPTPPTTYTQTLTVTVNCTAPPGGC